MVGPESRTVSRAGKSASTVGRLSTNYGVLVKILVIIPYFLLIPETPSSFISFTISSTPLLFRKLAVIDFINDRPRLLETPFPELLLFLHPV